MCYFDSITAMEKDKETEILNEDKITKKAQKEEAEASELRVYEVSYLLLPFITEDDISKEALRVKELVSVSGGAVFSEELPKLIKLAYTMTKVIANKNTKFDNAYFGWMKFEGEPETIAKLKKAFENNENVLRFLVLKTTKDVVSTRKPFPFTAKPVAKSAPVAPKEEVKLEVPEEIDEVELDKTIDDLVIN